jgi:hypothetical protein
MCYMTLDFNEPIVQPTRTAPRGLPVIGFLTHRETGAQILMLTIEYVSSADRDANNATYTSNNVGGNDFFGGGGGNEYGGRGSDAGRRMR